MSGAAMNGDMAIIPSPCWYVVGRCPTPLLQPCRLGLQVGSGPGDAATAALCGPSTAIL
jgi:hypothetical protein